MYSNTNSDLTLTVLEIKAARNHLPPEYRKCSFGSHALGGTVVSFTKAQDKHTHLWIRRKNICSQSLCKVGLNTIEPLGKYVGDCSIPWGTDFVDKRSRAVERNMAGENAKFFCVSRIHTVFPLDCATEDYK